MESIKRSIVVRAPVEEVYERWSRVEEFPLFMNSLREVRREGERRFHCRGERDGLPCESVEEISLMIPNRRIAWRNVSGAEASGVVTFDRLEPESTRITLDMACTPDGGWHDPSVLGERIEETLETFRRLIEPGVIEDLVTNNWRGF